MNKVLPLESYLRRHCHPRARASPLPPSGCSFDACAAGPACFAWTGALSWSCLHCSRRRRFPSRRPPRHPWTASEEREVLSWPPAAKNHQTNSVKKFQMFKISSKFPLKISCTQINRKSQTIFFFFLYKESLPIYPQSFRSDFCQATFPPAVVRNPREAVAPPRLMAWMLNAHNISVSHQYLAVLT